MRLRIKYINEKALLSLLCSLSTGAWGWGGDRHIYNNSNSIWYIKADAWTDHQGAIVINYAVDENSERINIQGCNVTDVRDNDSPTWCALLPHTTYRIHYIGDQSIAGQNRNENCIYIEHPDHSRTGAVALNDSAKGDITIGCDDWMQSSCYWQ